MKPPRAPARGISAEPGHGERAGARRCRHDPCVGHAADCTACAAYGRPDIETPRHEARLESSLGVLQQADVFRRAGRRAAGGRLLGGTGAPVPDQNLGCDGREVCREYTLKLGSHGVVIAERRANGEETWDNALHGNKANGDSGKPGGRRGEFSVYRELAVNSLSVTIAFKAIEASGSSGPGRLIGPPPSLSRKILFPLWR